MSDLHGDAFDFGVKLVCEELLRVAIHGANNEGDVTCKDIIKAAASFGVTVEIKEEK